MHKLFTPYLYFIYALGVVSLLLSFSRIELHFNLALVIISIFIVISEIKAIPLSENSVLSLLGVQAIFALTIAPIFNVLISLVLAIIIRDLFQVYYFKEKESIFNIKTFFNVAMHTSCIYISYLLGFSLITCSPLNLIVSYAIYSFFNNIFLFLILKLYNNSSFSLTFKKEQLNMTFYEVMILLLLNYAYLAYEIIGIIFILVFVVSYQSVAINNNIKKAIEQNINQDNLTKIFNRKSLNYEISDKLLNRVPFGLIFIDLDNFKSINDTYGHNIGDKVLIHFSKTLNDKFKTKIYRYGGDEFCILLNQDENTKYYLRVIESLKNYFKVDIGDKVIPYKVSCGVFSYKGEHTSIEEIFYFSSSDMHKNKLKNKNNSYRKEK
jgi:diguanylate cyclase (GGDEF)-like protein